MRAGATQTRQRHQRSPPMLRMESSCCRLSCSTASSDGDRCENRGRPPEEGARLACWAAVPTHYVSSRSAAPGSWVSRANHRFAQGWCLFNCWTPHNHRLRRSSRGDVTSNVPKKGARAGELKSARGHCDDDCEPVPGGQADGWPHGWKQPAERGDTLKNGELLDAAKQPDSTYSLRQTETSDISRT